MSELYRDFLDRKLDDVIDAIDNIPIVNNPEFDASIAGTLISVNSNVPYIKSYAFAYQTYLVDVNLPKISTLGASAFQSCSNLEKLDFKQEITTISANCFINCTKFNTLILRHNSITSLASINAFNGTPFASTGTGGKI